MDSSKKVYVIGFDGADKWLMDYWIEKGEMPFLASLQERSAVGFSESAVPPVTAPAWNSFLTGKNPGKHGVYDFMIEDRKTGDFFPAGTAYRKEFAIWHWIEKAGGVSVNINTPTTYPPEKTNGVCISGFLTPPNKDDYISPQSLVKEIEDKFGKYPLAFETPAALMNISTNAVNRFINECISGMEYKLKVSDYLIKKYGPNYFFIHLFGNDQISHAFWALLDKRHWDYNAAESKKYHAKIATYYRRFDELMRSFYERYLNENSTIFLMSDHGFGPWNRTVALNTWLLKKGYMKIKRRFTSMVKYFFWRIGITREWAYRNFLVPIFKLGFYKKEIPFLHRYQSFYKNKNALMTRDDIDFTRCRAIAAQGFGQIYIKVKGKYKDGCVPKEDYESLVTELIDQLRKLRDPKTGKIIGAKIYRKNEIYTGEELESAPDITYLPLESGYLGTTLWGFDFNKTISDPMSFTGTHRQKGICWITGRGFDMKHQSFNFNLMDFLPTILYLLGGAFPRDVDGKVRTDLMLEGFPETHHVEYCEPERPHKKEDEKSEDENKAIEKTLKGLGYL